MAGILPGCDIAGQERPDRVGNILDLEDQGKRAVGNNAAPYVVGDMFRVRMLLR